MKIRTLRSIRAKRNLVANARKVSVGPNKIDPTRTSSIRRSVTQALRKKFAELKGKVFKLIVTDDEFGLQMGNDLKMARNAFVENWCNQYGGDTCKDGRTGPTDKVRSKRERSARAKQEADASADSVTKVANRFVEGLNASKVSPAKQKEYLKSVYSVLDSMPPGAVDRIEQNLKTTEFFDNTRALGMTAKVSPEIMKKLRSGEVTVGGYYSTKEQRLALDGKGTTLSQTGIYAHEMTHAIDGPNFEISRSSEWSSAFLHEFSRGQLTKYGGTKPSEALAEFGRVLYGDKADPAALRQRFPRAVAVFESRGLLPTHFNATRNADLQVQEIFGEYLETEDGHADALLTPSLEDLTENRFEFKSSPEKLAEFQRWLRARFGETLTNDRRLWQRYAQEGYAKGAGRAFDDTQGRRRQRWRPGEGQFYDGTKHEFLRSSFGRPETVEKIQLLASRTYSDLTNVTEDMATRMGRTLTDALTQGMNPREAARLLNADLDVGANRAEVIARTEIIRAHAEGQLDSMKRLGVDKVGAQVEWSTAGDGRVCPQCSDMEGTIMSIDDARGLIPAHPQCRCAWLPVIDEGDDEEE